MPQIEPVVDKPVAPQEDRAQKLPISAEAYDVVQGVMHVTLQALACAALNPIDKKNAELVTSKTEIKYKKGRITHRSAHVATTVNPIALMPVNTTTTALTIYKPQVNSIITTVNNPVYYSVNSGAAYFPKFKNIFPDRYWAGTLYGIKTNIPRNAVAFTALPLLRDELEESFTPTESKVIAGAGTGIIESLFTARARVIKVIMHTSTEHFSNKQVWEMLPIKARGEKVKAAIKWGSAKGVAYWIPFPFLTQMFEGQFKYCVDQFKLGDSYAINAVSYMAAGGAAGAITPFISYPLDVLEKRAILNPAQNQVQKTWDYYCRYGLRNSIVHNTHVGFLKTALPRMVISSAFFNLTLHMAKSICNTGLVKKEHHHHDSLVSTPSVSVAVSSSKVVGGVGKTEVAVTPSLPVKPSVEQLGKSSVVPAVVSPRYKSNPSAKFFTNPIQVAAVKSGMSGKLFGSGQAVALDSKRVAGFLYPWMQRSAISKPQPPAAVANVKLESVKLKA